MWNTDDEKTRFRGLFKYCVVLRFSVSFLSQVVINPSFVSEPLSETNASISLPSQLNDFFPPGGRNTTRVQFQFYGTQDLFKVLLTLKKRPPFAIQCVSHYPFFLLFFFK